MKLWQAILIQVKKLNDQVKKFTEKIIKHLAYYFANHSKPVLEKTGNSKYSLIKMGLLSCLALFLISVLCSCAFFFALVLLPKHLLPTPVSQYPQNNPDKDKLNQDSFDKRIQELLGPESLMKKDDAFLVSINEEKLKDLIVDNTEKDYSKESLEKGLSIDFEPNLITLQLDTKLILKPNVDTFTQNDKFTFDVPAFDQGLLQNYSPNFINLEITTSDDGKNFLINKLSTENLDSDSFLSKLVARVIEMEINKFIAENLNQRSYSLEKIEIKKDVLYLRIRDKGHNQR